VQLPGKNKSGPGSSTQQVEIESPRSQPRPSRHLGFASRRVGRGSLLGFLGLCARKLASGLADVCSLSLGNFGQW